MSEADISRSLLPAMARTVLQEKGPLSRTSPKLVDEWHALLSRPLPKGIKYGKALQRILGHHPTLYLAVEYRDAAAFQDEELAAAFCTPKGAEAWRLLALCNRAVLCALGVDMDRLPSREEIQANIQSCKVQRKSNDASSVPHAFRTELLALAATIEGTAGAELAKRAGETDEKTLCEEWGRMTAAHPSFVEDCKRRAAPPVAAWLAFTEVERAGIVESLCEESAPAWVHVDQLNSFGNLASHIPTNIMSKIEGMASKLAGDLQSGAIAMDGLDLQGIGEQVLRECDPNDLTALTQNLGAILPAISELSHAR